MDHYDLICHIWTFLRFASSFCLRDRLHWNGILLLPAKSSTYLVENFGWDDLLVNLVLTKLLQLNDHSPVRG